jgi:transcription initiation factor TFIIIB Brf1 subunit/transcription initiation factor TFIIB
MAGNDKDSDRSVPTNGWGEWRYYVLEKLKDQQETIEHLRKENADLQLNMSLMREKKLEQRHEELKRRVHALTETAEVMKTTVDLFKEERKDKRLKERKLWLAVIQGFVAIVIALVSAVGKGCASEHEQKKPAAPASASAATDPK